MLNETKAMGVTQTNGWARCRSPNVTARGISEPAVRSGHTGPARERQAKESETASAHAGSPRSSGQAQPAAPLSRAQTPGPKPGPRRTGGCGGVPTCLPTAAVRCPAPAPEGGGGEGGGGGGCEGRGADGGVGAASAAPLLHPAVAQRCLGRRAPGGRLSSCPGPRRAGERGQSGEEEKRDQNPIMAAAAPSPPAEARFPRPAPALLSLRRGAGPPGGPRYLLPGDTSEPPPTSANTKEN